jgi:hypothetical protein
MNNKKEIDQKLLEACTADQIDLTEIEQLLKDGANPLGCVEDYDGDNNLYDVVLYHFLDLVQGDKDDSAFFKITELFLKYGMDITQPEIPYNHDDSINPMWSFAFYSSEAALQSLKLLLDHGLDADSAGTCWGHELTDVGFAGFEVNNSCDCEMATESFKKLMLIASYPHIISVDDDLKREIWYDENNYDITSFREWNRYEYVFEPTVNYYLNKSIIRIFEKDTKNEVWKFGFELSPEEWKS